LIDFLKDPYLVKGVKTMGAAAADQRNSHQISEIDKIGLYLDELNTLKKGAQAVTKLIACGRPAVEPLRQFLLFGKPGVVYHPRRWAVEALAGLGARDVLLEYLGQKKEIADPAIQLGEEIVESAAARELTKWPSEAVFQVLLEIAQQRCLTGVLETLGEFKRAEAIPFLVKALEDDVCRSAAEEALRKMGLPAKPELIKAATTPRPSRDAEAPASLLRRLSSVRLIAEMWVSPYDWQSLRPLLNETDPEILIALFKIAEAAAGAKDRALAFRLLIGVIENAGWYLKSEIETALAGRLNTIGSLVEEEISHRFQGRDRKATSDPVLAMLLRVKHRVEQRESPSLST
jgi:hypothetical protein